MTTIIGFVDKENKCTYMGCDSRMSIGDIHIKDTQSKILNLSNKLLIGGSGSFRDLNIIESSYNILELVENNDITRKFLLMKFIPTIFEEFTKYRAMNTNDNNYDSQYLIAVKDKLFYIDAYGTLCESKDLYFSIGSGSYFSFGSLYTLKDNKEMSVIDKITSSLKTSAYFDRNSGGPFYIYNTKDFKKIKK
mgnify:CR=1 FL=1